MTTPLAAPWGLCGIWKLKSLDDRYVVKIETPDGHGSGFLVPAPVGKPLPGMSVLRAINPLLRYYEEETKKLKMNQLTPVLARPMPQSPMPPLNV